MLKAVIFDFDGVIANTEPVHFEAFRVILNEEGELLTEAQYYARYLAYDDRTFFEKLLKDRDIDASEDYILELMKRKSAAYDNLIDGNIRILPGVLDLIGSLRGKVRLAIGSGALKKEITDILEYAGIGSDFETIASAEDVEKSKPEPDVFLEALRRLDSGGSSQTSILPGECVVIEDSVSGISAAKSAGMKCIAVCNSYSAAELCQADLVVDTLEGLGFEEIAELSD